MKTYKTATSEVANRHLAEMHKMIGGQQCHDDVVWDGLSLNDRIVFCRLAGCPDFTCEKTAGKAFVDINMDMRHNLIVAIKRMGSIAKQFNCLATKRNIKDEGDRSSLINDIHVNARLASEVVA